MSADRDRVEIRLAEGGERRACRMLLPDAAQRGELGELWGAWETDGAATQRLVGAVSVQPIVLAGGRAEAVASGRVIHTHRRRGLGTRLLEVAGAETRRLGLPAVRVVCGRGRDADADGDGAAAFLFARDFEVVDVLTTFEVETRAVVASLGPLRDRMNGWGVIPEGARMVRLREAPLDAVARLHAQHLGGTVRSVSASISERLDRADADDHAVLLLDGEVHGLLFGTTVDGTTTIDAEVLSPTCRVSGGSSGWASIFMLAERLEWGLSRGSRITRFSCVSGNRPTRRLARRLGARPVREEVVQRRRLEGWASSGVGDGGR